MWRGLAGACVVLALVALTACRRRIEVLGYRCVRLESGARVPEFDGHGAVYIPDRGPAPIALLQRGTVHILTATRAPDLWDRWVHPLGGAAPGAAELEIDGARQLITIADGEGEVELLGQRAFVETRRGVVREFDALSLPFFSVYGAVTDPRITFTSTSGTFRLAVAAIEPRGEWNIVRTATLAGDGPRAGRGELHFQDRAWPVAWVAKSEPSFAGWSEAELARRAEHLPGRVRHEAYTELASLFRKRGDSRAQARALMRAAAAAEENGVPSETARSLRAAAFAHLYARRFSEVDGLLTRAEAIDRKISNTSGLVRAAYYRGLMYTELGRYAAARAVLSAALARAERAGLDGDRAFLSVSLAVLLREMGRHEEALRVHRASEPHLRKPQDRVSYLIGLGWTELRILENGGAMSFEQVRRHLVEALSEARRIHASAQEADALANLLWLAHLEGDAAESETRLEELARHPQLDDSYAQLFIPFARAQIRFHQRRYAEAERAFRELEQRARSEAGGATSDYVWRAAYGLAQTSLARGDRRTARARFEEAIALLDQLGLQTEVSRSRALFFQDRRHLYQDAAGLAVEEGRFFDAFVITDRARSHVYSSLDVKLRNERADLEPLAAYSALRAEYEQRRRNSDLADPTRDPAFAEETARMRARLTSLFDELYSREPKAALELTRANLAAVLGEDAALLAYAERAGATDAFWVTAHGAHLRRRSEHLLHWAPRMKAVRHLYVIPGGAVSIDAVIEQLAASPRLLQRFSVSFLTHAGALLTETSSASGAPVVVADPDQTLPIARREGEWVARELGAGARLLTEQRADRAAVLSAIHGARVFHFSGHGVIEAAQPWDVHLVLARQETLSLEDLLISRPGIGLVVLSGCETGKGRPLSASEQIGLAQTFSLVGARAVLATVREVDDAAAFSFTQQFYAAGGARQPAEAWRRVALAANEPTWKSYYVLGRR